MMILGLVHLFAISPQTSGAIRRLTPLGFLDSTTRREGFLSDDGTTLYRGFVDRLDLRTGKWARGEALRVALLQPPNVFARTMSQGLEPPQSGEVTFGMQNVTLQAEALDDHRLLTATETETRGSRYYIPITEFDFRQRGKHPNVSWVVPAPHGSGLVAVRYLNAEAVEAWVREPQGRAWTLARYLGDRRQKGRDSFMRLASRSLLKWPEGPGTPVVIPNSYDAVTRTFIQQTHPGSPNGALRLVNTLGKVLKEVPLHPSGPLEWVMRTEDAKVPGGKAVWEPLVCSRDRKAWLLKRRTDGKAFLLRM